jgi:hypothetical protein
MAGIFDDLRNVVENVAVTAAPEAMTAAGVSPTSPAAATGDRLATLEQFALTWGPTLLRLAPLLEKLEAL